jgi:thiol:disulfide interchange protein
MAFRRRYLLIFALTSAACSSPSKPDPSPPSTSATPPPATSDAPPVASTTPSASPSASASVSAVAEPPAAPSGESDPQAALATAKKEGKPALLVFCAKWVAACAETSHVLAETTVRKTLDERFVVARVDVSNEDDAATKERMKQFKVKGLPFMIAFDKKGKEVGRESGSIDASRLTKLLDKAK